MLQFVTVLLFLVCGRGLELISVLLLSEPTIRLTLLLLVYFFHINASLLQVVKETAHSLLDTRSHTMCL
jgi:hypothetical protein